jgi:hypothetical protein
MCLNHSIVYVLMWLLNVTVFAFVSFHKAVFCFCFISFSSDFVLLIYIYHVSQLELSYAIRVIRQMTPVTRIWNVARLHIDVNVQPVKYKLETTAVNIKYNHMIRGHIFD